MAPGDGDPHARRASVPAPGRRLEEPRRQHGRRRGGLPWLGRSSPAAPGFIGSHLDGVAARRRARRHRRRLLQRQLRRADKRANLQPPASTTASSSSQGDLAELDAARADRRLRRRLPPRRRARRARELGRALRRLHAPQRRPPPSGCWRPHAAPGVRFVYASSSSVYGDALRLPTREDATPRPLSPYGVTKLAAEHLCVLYATPARRRHGRAALLLRLRPAPAAGHGVPPLLRGDRSPASRSSSTATATRRATSPTSPTSSTATRAAGDGRAAAVACSTSAAARG